MSQMRAPKAWDPNRPHTLVVACSDGRLQDATDAFLSHELGLIHFDRFYMPGGGGALASSGRDFLRAQQLKRECAYLVELHEVSRIVLLFHGPAEDGPADSVCADYRRKLPWASPAMLRDRQRQDAAELILHHNDWAGSAEVTAYSCEVDYSHHVHFVPLDPEQTLNR
jgi:hypothetical protein